VAHLRILLLLFSGSHFLLTALPGEAGGLQSVKALELVACSIFEKMGIGLPAREAPEEPVIEIATVVVPGASTAVSLAMTPLAIVFRFAPVAKQR
jgi:hypothetical protein